MFGLTSAVTVKYPKEYTFCMNKSGGGRWDNHSNLFPGGLIFSFPTQLTWPACMCHHCPKKRCLKGACGGLTEEGSFLCLR